MRVSFLKFHDETTGFITELTNSEIYNLESFGNEILDVQHSSVVDTTGTVVDVIVIIKYKPKSEG